MKPIGLGNDRVDPVVLDFVRHAVMAPSADNSQPWRFHVGEGMVRCKYAHANETSDVFGEFGHATILSAGALQETIDSLLKLTKSQLSTAHLSDSWHIDFDVPTRPLPVCDALLAIERRHTNRFSYRALPDGEAGRYDGLTLDGARVCVIRDRGRIGEVERAVRLCSEARFNSELLHEWLFSSLRWGDEEVLTGDGLDLRSVDLPPGGSAFMRFISPWSRMRKANGLGLYKLLARVDSIPVGRAPCLMAIIGTRSSIGTWNAGRLLQRLWVEVNSINLAVHPYYVITDLTNRIDSLSLTKSLAGGVSMAREIVERVLELKPNEQLHMLLRVGDPTRSAVRSRRRNAATFVSVG